MGDWTNAVPSSTVNKSMKTIALLTVITVLCAACFAAGFFLGQHGKANNVAASLEGVLPSLRPASRTDIADLRTQIDDLNRRLQVLAERQTNFILVTKTNFNGYQRAINYQGAQIRQLQLQSQSRRQQAQ